MMTALKSKLSSKITKLQDMFSNKKKLTDREKETLRCLNDEYKQFIKQYMTAPDSFDNVLRCLEHYKEIQLKFLRFMEPFLSDQMKQAEKIAEARWNLVKLLNAKHKQREYKGVLAEIHSILFDGALKKLLEEAFTGKPVTGLNMKYKAEEKSGYKTGNGFHEQFTYELRFSDGTKIIWHSLEDEREVQSAREAFEQRIPQPKKAKRPEPEPVAPPSETPGTMPRVSEAPGTMPRVSGSDTFFRPKAPPPIKPQQTAMDYIGTVCAMLGGM